MTMLYVPCAVTHCAAFVTPCACPVAQAHQEFWDMVAAANCTLISVDESGDGDVTQADADAVSHTLWLTALLVLLAHSVRCPSNSSLPRMHL